MILKYKMRVSAICLACFSVNVNAQLLSADWQTVGDNLITQDTVTGLNWLDLTETNGMSYNDVSAELGTGDMFEGFRYATSAEVISLWSINFGTDLSAGAPTSGSGPATQGVIDASNLMGNLWNEYASWDYDYGITGITATVDPSNTGNHEVLGALSWYQMEYYTEGFYSIPDNTTIVGVNIGSYLVYDTGMPAVPVPAAAWLFSSGLIGLAGITRRLTKQANASI